MNQVLPRQKCIVTGASPILGYRSLGVPTGAGKISGESRCIFAQTTAHGKNSPVKREPQTLNTVPHDPGTMQTSQAGKSEASSSH